MIYEIPNFITFEQLDYIKSEIKNSINNNSNICRNELNSYRDGKTLNISQEKTLKDLDSFLFQKVFGLKSLLNFIKQRYQPFFETADTGYEFHRYSPGDLCNIHADVEVLFNDEEQNQESLLRFASVVLHLNTPSSGGDLIFPTLNRTVKTEAGKLVIFPPYGFAKHYTTESPDNRDVIVTWFVYKNLLVRKI